MQLIALSNGVAATEPAMPKLSIESVQGLVVVSYPPGLHGWMLQASADAAPGNWDTLATPDHTLTVAPDNAR